MQPDRGRDRDPEDRLRPLGVAERLGGGGLNIDGRRDDGRSFCAGDPPSSHKDESTRDPDGSSKFLEISHGHTFPVETGILMSRVSKRVPRTAR